jgi:hypothetical protein
LWWAQTDYRNGTMDMQLLQSVELAIPIFHSYGHSGRCQVLNENCMSMHLLSQFGIFNTLFLELKAVEGLRELSEELHFMT